MINYPQPSAIVQPGVYLSHERQEFIDDFTENQQRGRGFYWKSCTAAFGAHEEHEKNGWPTWAQDLADGAGLKESDTIRNHANAERMFLRGAYFDYELAHKLRKEKPHSYFLIAWKHAEPENVDDLRDRTLDLLHDIQTADSTRELRIFLSEKYDMRTPVQRFSDRVKKVARDLTNVRLEGVRFKMPVSKQNWIRLVVSKLEFWDTK